MQPVLKSLVIGAAACALLAPVRSEPAAFRWPAPNGWQKETIPFPLGFAPELKYRGVEELRFAPGFFHADSPNYWSYAFAWWLEGTPALDRKALETDLARYFSGLSQVVGGKKYRFNPARFQARLKDAPAEQRQGHAVRHLTGTLDTYDPFVTGKEITLQVEVRTWDCPTAGRRVLLLQASPQSREHPVWKSLGEREKGFACH